jgi:hypothetical protein
MDWKRLVQFALLGSSDLERYAILLVRVSIGLFFAISWANKLFVAGGTETINETLVKARVPFLRKPVLQANRAVVVYQVVSAAEDRLVPDHLLRRLLHPNQDADAVIVRARPGLDDGGEILVLSR